MNRVVIAFLMLSSACGAPEPGRFPVRFVAGSGEAAVEDVSIAVGSSVLGRTDARGVLDVSLVGREGQTLALSASCPEGYRAGGAIPPLVLRQLRTVDAHRRAERLHIAVPCLPEARTAMLVVRADGEAELPVIVDGREVARTDASGLAHVELTYAPYTTFEVVLRTDDRPELSPRNPARELTVPDAERIFVVDQRFVRPDVRPPPVRRARVRERHLPQRITSAGRWGTTR